MVVAQHLAEALVSGSNHRQEIAVRKLHAFRGAGRAGRIHDSGEVVGMGVGDARLQLLVGDRHAQSLQSAQRVAVHHEDALQAGASVVDRIETVIAFAVIGDGELHAGVVDDALRLCRGIGVVDRHVHRADRGEREIQHAPLEAGGGEQRHRVSLADADRDEPLRCGEHQTVELAGGDARPRARAGLARRDGGRIAGAGDAFGEQRVQCLVVVHGDVAGGGVFADDGRNGSGADRPRGRCRHTGCRFIRRLGGLGRVRLILCLILWHRGFPLQMS